MRSLDPSVRVHPQALVESEHIGENTRIWAFAHVLSGSRIGSHCNICDYCFIEGGATVGNGVTIKNGVSVWDMVTIDDDVFVGPNVVFTNDSIPRAFRKSGRARWKPTRIKKGATLGAGAVIVCGINIGEYAFVGAGAVVTKSVPPFSIVFGNPARIQGYTCPCMAEKVDATRVSFQPTCNQCADLWKPLA